MPVVLTDPLANNKTVVLWDNHFERTTNQYTNDSATNPASNSINDSTFDYWEQLSTTGPTRMKKIGTAATLRANALGISGHNLGTTAGTIFLLYSEDDINYTNVVLPYSPLSDEDILFIFPERTHLYWQVAFTGTGGSYISNVKLGMRLDFPYTPIEGYRPTHHSRKFTKYFNNSIEGHLLGNRVMSSGGTTTVEFPDVARSFADGPLLGFKNHYDRGRAFFYAGWPNGKPQDIAYAWADSEDAAIDVAYTHGSKRASVAFGMSMKYGR